jgi:hypothetical protein
MMLWNYHQIILMFTTFGSIHYVIESQNQIVNCLFNINCVYNGYYMMKIIHMIVYVVIQNMN